MDTVRYVLALLVVAATPPGILLWYAIHPLARRWRRLGALGTYAILGPLALGLVFLVASARDTLLSTDPGTSWLGVGIGVSCLCAAGVLATRRRRQLGFAVLAGLPELSPESYPPRLIQEGVYAHIRHPRYVELWLAVAGYSSISNYPAAWATTLASIPALWLVVALEERELADRFGEAWVEYARRVPRFLPRRGPAPGASPE